MRLVRQQLAYAPDALGRLHKMLDNFGFERIQRVLAYLAVPIADRSRFVMKTLRLVLEKTDVNVAVIIAVCAFFL